jgi:hypothetical protein
MFENMRDKIPDYSEGRTIDQKVWVVSYLGGAGLKYRVFQSQRAAMEFAIIMEAHGSKVDEGVMERFSNE